MPKYQFECHTCSIRFDRVLKMGDHPTHECPSCKEEAPRIFDGNGFGFGFTSSSSAAPANTGVHDQDYPTADKAVGRSAEKRWETYRERDQVKSKVRQVGSSPALTRVDGDGYTDYTAMSVPERSARKKLVDYAVAVEKQPRLKTRQ